MRADNNGEGGVLALATLAHRQKLGRKVKAAIGVGAILGRALFYGDGMLPPAISVLSAVEGLTVGRQSLEPLVMPLTLIILVVLFLIQSRGIAKIGRLFGPVMFLWFILMAVMGVMWIVCAPIILTALNPWYAVQ